MMIAHIDKEIKSYVTEIHKIIEKSGEVPEGNVYTNHQSLIPLKNEQCFKQINLWNLGAEAENIMEIGFNAGHSAVIMLTNKGKQKTITFYDINHHKYTQPCYEFVKSKFPHIKFEAIWGDSLITLPLAHGQYDLIHLDGGHRLEHITNDIVNSLRLLKAGGTLIVDDTQDKIIDLICDMTKNLGLVEERGDTQGTKGYTHRIFKKK